MFSLVVGAESPYVPSSAPVVATFSQDDRCRRASQPVFGDSVRGHFGYFVTNIVQLNDQQ